MDVATHQAMMHQFNLNRDNFPRDPRIREQNLNSQVIWRNFRSSLPDNRRRPKVVTREQARKNRALVNHIEFIRAIHDLNAPLPPEML